MSLHIGLTDNFMHDRTPGSRVAEMNLINFIYLESLYGMPIIIIIMSYLRQNHQLFEHYFSVCVSKLLIHKSYMRTKIFWRMNDIVFYYSSIFV